MLRQVRGDCCICVAGGLADAPCKRLRAAEPAGNQVTRMLAFAAALHSSLFVDTSGAGAGGVPTSVRMGIALGDAAFLLGGPAGGETSFLSVQGDVANLAARMEALASPGFAMVHASAAGHWAEEEAGRQLPAFRLWECKGKGQQPAVVFDCERGEFCAGDVAGAPAPSSAVAEASPPADMDPSVLSAGHPGQRSCPSTPHPHRSWLAVLKRAASF